jgi:hypothetical protein
MLVNISKLFSVGGTVVFYSPKSYENKGVIYERILSGEEALDINGQVMSTEEASRHLFMSVRSIDSDPLEQMYANVLLAPKLISLVRTQLPSCEEPLTTITKLSSIIALISCGMFYTAATVLTAMEADTTLTRALLDRWAAMLLSANAVTDGT